MLTASLSGLMTAKFLGAIAQKFRAIKYFLGAAAQKKWAIHYHFHSIV
jgi:hypothetical protein